MGSEQSVTPKKPSRPPPVRKSHTIAASSITAYGGEPGLTASGSDSPGASFCSHTELPYISYTVDRPIGDSPKHTSKGGRAEPKKVFQRRHPAKAKRANTSDIIVVKPAVDSLMDEHLRQLQEIPTFLPIMRGTLGLPGARDPEVLEGLDTRPWVHIASRLQAHLAACAQPIASEQSKLTAKGKELDTEISRLYSQMVDKQRNNARQAERLARVSEVAHQLSRCNSLLNQTLQDIEELNMLLPEDKRLASFVWNEVENNKGL